MKRIEGETSGHSPRPKICIVGWIDLLGYGGMIGGDKFGPGLDRMRIARTRIRKFHDIVSSKSGPNFKTFTMNDGAAAYFDFGPKKDQEMRISRFITLCIELFDAVSVSESNDKYPGARMIIAAGFRFLGLRAGSDNLNDRLFEVMSEFRDGRIDEKTARSKIARTRPWSDIVPQLQANFAFTRAYLAEAAGSKNGFQKRGVYLDCDLFKEEVISQIQSKDIVKWSSTTPQMSGDFVDVGALFETLHLTRPIVTEDRVRNSECINDLVFQRLKAHRE